METLVTNLTIIFARLNELLSSAIIILAFSLFAYTLIYNIRSVISRGFAVLLACMCFTYVGDVALFNVHTLDNATPWLKFQWIGIAFTPAAYLHFSDVLLRTTNAVSSRRRFTVYIAYIFGFVLLLLAVYSDQLVRNPFYSPGITQFRSGPFFGFLLSIFTLRLAGVSIKLSEREHAASPPARAGE